jgi:protein-tyrosine-phosphatase
MFAQIKAYIDLIIGIALAILFVGTAWYSYHAGTQNQANKDAAAQAKEIAAYQAQVKTEQDRRDQITDVFIKKLDSIQIVNTTVNKNFTKELTNTVYTDCKVPETGVDLINLSASQLNDSRKATK